MKKKILTGFAALLFFAVGIAGLRGAGIAAPEKTDQSQAGETSLSTSDTGASISVRFIDVGQGDSSLVLCDGEAMLIDGGTPPNASKIYTALEENGVSDLKYLVCSHPHEDHVGGLAGALQYAECHQAWVPYLESDNLSFQKFKKKCKDKGVPVVTPTEGETYSLGSSAITILGPTDLLPDEVNNNSLVFRVDFGKTSFLFTGDAEQLEEQLLLHNEMDQLHCTVLKVPHHGSHGAASYAFYQAVSPAYAVISCGKDNSYGHPHRETLALLKKEGTRVYRTDLQGDIVCASDGEKVTFTTSKNENVNTLIAVVPEAVNEAIEATAASTGEGETGSYILNVRSKRFHYPDCPGLADMNEKNKEVFNGSRQEAISQGYEPCQICKP